MRSPLRSTALIGALGALAVLATTAQANTISVVDLSGNPIGIGGGPNFKQFTATCSPPNDVCIQGFLGDPAALDPAITSNSLDGSTTGYKGVGSSDAKELGFLNDLLKDLGEPEVTYYNKVDQPLSEFTTNRLYFLIKKSAWTAFFKNTSGGSVTVSFDPDTFSHYAEMGSVVPIPAAAWLFGSALLGMVGIGYRRRASART
ncbi:MAG: VPLPA-CTERM sorting domain-containing protein [Caldilineaceae bacterium]